MADLARAFDRADGTIRLVPPPTNPMAVARAFVREHHTSDGGTATIRHHRGDFYMWDGTCWPEAEEWTVRAQLYRWLEGRSTRGGR
jgi:putative DNA primase/helicase